MFAIEADARFVDQRGRERVRVTDRGSLGIDDLIARAKTAAVRKAGKGSRNKFGIVRPAIANEHLIVIGEVLIEAAVNGIDIVG